MKHLDDFKIISCDKNFRGSFRLGKEDVKITRDDIQEVFPEPFLLGKKELQYYQGVSNDDYFHMERDTPEGTNAIMYSYREQITTNKGNVVYPAVYCKVKDSAGQ